MKSFKILMMAVITILAFSLSAQVSTPKTEILNSICPVHPAAMCPDCEANLNLSSKEKMKYGIMKINAALLHKACTETANLSLSAKEKMKTDAIKKNASSMTTLAITGKATCCVGLKELTMSNSCPLISHLMIDNQVKRQTNQSDLNLSSKEKMKREAMKI